jgi:hypothetical protein
MNLSLMRKRQRLSAIKEIKAMMQKMRAEEDGCQASPRLALEVAEDDGLDSDLSDSNDHQEGSADAEQTVKVAQSELWKFAVNRRTAHCSLRGSTSKVRGVRTAVWLDLTSCGQRQSEWRKMLPELEHVMQHCRLYLVVEYEWSDVPGPALEVCNGGEILMTQQQQQYFDQRFMTFTNCVEHARVFTRMELRCPDGKEKVS